MFNINTLRVVILYCGLIMTLIAISVNVNGQGKLYRYCKHDIDFTKFCSGLTPGYTPVWSEKGGKLTPMPGNNTVISVLPTDNKEFTFYLHNKTNDGKVLLCSYTFAVEEAPRPVFRLLVNGTEYNGRSPIKLNDKIELKIEPISTFANNFPLEARYRINKIKLIRENKGEEFEFATLYEPKNSERPHVIIIPQGAGWTSTDGGEKLIIEIDGIDRMNSENKFYAEDFNKKKDLKIIFDVIP